MAVCWLADNHWSRDPDLPTCQGYDGAIGTLWPKGDIANFQCPNTWNTVFPYKGLVIRGYEKTGTQLINRIYSEVNR